MRNVRNKYLWRLENVAGQTAHILMLTRFVTSWNKSCRSFVPLIVRKVSGHEPRDNCLGHVKAWFWGHVTYYHRFLNERLIEDGI